MNLTLIYQELTVFLFLALVVSKINGSLIYAGYFHEEVSFYLVFLLTFSGEVNKSSRTLVTTSSTPYGLFSNLF